MHVCIFVWFGIKVMNVCAGDIIGVNGYAFVQDLPVYECTVSAHANDSRTIRGDVMTADSEKLIFCQYPLWPYPAELVNLRLWRDGREISMSPALVNLPATLQFEIIEVWWGRSVPRIIAFNAEISIDIDGFGFTPSPDPIVPTYECRWTESSLGAEQYSVSTGGVCLSSSRIQCR